MDRDAEKRAAAEAALVYVRAEMVLGVGSGTTVGHFIRAMAAGSVRPRAAVAASERTRGLLEAAGIRVVELTGDVLPLDVCVDGADEVDGALRLLKGGGGALTREKVIATAARLFVCIVDESKLAARLGAFPVAVEVVPMAIHAVERALRALGGTPEPRAEFVTDNGNFVLDVLGLDLSDPEALELAVDAIPGVVECGVFARRPADAVLVGTPGGVRRIER